MTEVCRPAKCVVAGRVAVLDQCTLLPVAGAMNGYAFGCIIDPDWNDEVEDAEESTVKDNCNNVCLYDPGCPKVKGATVEFKLSKPDPELEAILHGDPLIVDGGGVSIGVRRRVQECTPYVFLELFEETDDCDAQGDEIIRRHIWPAVRLRHSTNEREGIFRIEQYNGVARDVFTTTIGDGPFNDIPAYFAGAPATEKLAYTYFEDTTVPTIVCGAIAVPAQA